MTKRSEELDYTAFMAAECDAWEEFPEFIEWCERKGGYHTPKNKREEDEIKAIRARFHAIRYPGVPDNLHDHHMAWRKNRDLSKWPKKYLPWYMKDGDDR